MATVSIRQLQTNAAAVIDKVIDSGAAIITRNGEPVAILSQFPVEALDDLVARTSPDIVTIMDAFETELAAGSMHTVSQEQIKTDLELG
ncbi:MAG TPA: type II toxin-antitoxin system Phd/YefM family antitoxin [Acidimicrobiales bacterium]|jgi:PHD/YefM family antitoxin component YafN of YafNO toxin-antitoxin module|nr:type II toxin-antitoxin system Phd/YefM family antitoxin [Acidimicrobiales bacterium]